MSSTQELLERLTTVLNEQVSYDDTNKNPTADNKFNPPYSGFIISTSDGDFGIRDASGNTITIDQSFINEGQIYQISVSEIVGSNNSQTLSNVILLRE